MTDQFGTNDFSNQNNCSESPNDYLARAASACKAGDLVLGMHLYLAAYEKAAADPDIPDGMALAGLHEAWALACELKERSMAEYVFEKLEPFLTTDEIPEYANELQNLALDRLEEYGFSREELADMAKMISNDLMGGEGSVLKVEQISIPQLTESQDLSDLALDEEEDLSLFMPESNDANTDEGQAEQADFIPASEKRSEHPNQIGMGIAEVNDFNPYDLLNTSSVGTSYHAATNDGAGEYVFTRDEDRVAESRRAREEAKPQDRNDTAALQTDDDAGKTPLPAGAPDQALSPTAALTASSSALPDSEALAEQLPDAPALSEVPQADPGVFSYRNLAGYDEVIAVMRDFGVGLQRDHGFQNFVKMMNARHGLSRMPSLDTVLFRSPVIEDAARFLEATVGEIGLPVLRMSMEENVQGMPMLCVSVQGNSRPRMNHAHNRFEGPGILVIEDLDLWALPSVPEGMEGFGNFMMANISRGAREAVNLIHSAVEDPNVYVLVTATTNGEVDPFFYDLLEPMSVIEIGYPNDHDREAIWAEIMGDHPSMSSLDISTLVRLSAGLARYDIYLAAREALEDAYKAGLMKRRYLPVTPQNIYDKLAACQPLDSNEYRAIEDEVVKSFADELDHLEDWFDESR